jgi:hypothetical protein
MMSEVDLALILAQRKDMGRLIGRLQDSQVRSEREALGLHAALVEAVRRLRSLDQPTDDLWTALEHPGEAPLAWRTRTQDLSTRERSDLYDTIFGEAAD